MRSSILTILSLSTLSLAARHEHNRLFQHRDLVERTDCSDLLSVGCTSASSSTHATPSTTSSSSASTPTTSVKTSTPVSSTKSIPTTSSTSKIETSSSSSTVVRSTHSSSTVVETTSSTSSSVSTSSSSTLSSSSSTLSSSSSITSKTSIVSKPSTSVVAPSSAATRTVGTADSDAGASNSTAGALPTGSPNNVDASKSKSFLSNTGAAVPVFIILALVAIGALYGVSRYLRRQRRLRDEAEAAAYFDSMGQQDEFGAAEEKGHPDYFSEDGDHMQQVQPAPMGAYTNSELHYGPGMTAEDFYGVPPPPAGVYNPTGALALESYSGPQHQHQPMQQQQYGGYATDYPVDYPPTDGVALGPPPVSTPGGPAVHAQPYHMNAPTITITPDYPSTHQF